MRNRHRIMGLVLALAMLLQLAPAMPLVTRAEGQSAVSRVIVDGEAILSGQYMVSGTHQVRDTKPETGGYLYYEEGYLLLENYSFTSNSYNTIVSEQALTIELVGENTLVGNYMWAIRHTTEEPLVICGQGSLTVSGRIAGISAYGDVTLNANITADRIELNGNLYIEGGTIHATSTDGAAVGSGNLYMNGGVLVATGTTGGISTGRMEVNGGDLTAISTDTENDSKYYALHVRYGMSSSYLTVSNGLQILAATEPDGVPGAADFDAWGDYDYIHIFDAGVEVDGVRLFSGQYLSQGSDAPAQGTPTGSYAHYEGGVLTLNDISLSSIHGYSGKLKLQGESRLNGRLVMDTDLTVTGTGSLEVNFNSDDPAIWVRDALLVEGGTLTVTNPVGRGCEVGLLQIDNGTVTVDGGVKIYGGMVVNGGFCRIVSQGAHPAVELVPPAENIYHSVHIYGGSLELFAAQTSAISGGLDVEGGAALVETGAPGCRVVTERVSSIIPDDYECLIADEPGGELVRNYATEIGQFSRLCIRPHVCAPELVEEVKPTCGDVGKLAYYRCACSKYYEDAAATILIPNIYEYGNLDALGHDTEGVAYTFDKNWHYKFCKVCGAKDLDTDGRHEFGEGLSCFCGATRTGTVEGMITLQVPSSVTIRLWKGDVLISEYQTYGTENHYAIHQAEAGVYTLEVEVWGYEYYRAEITLDRLSVVHNVEMVPRANTISGSISSNMGWTDPVTLNLYQDGVLMHSVTTEGSPAYFTLENVLTGIYYMELIKKDHEYVYTQIEISGSSDGWDLILDVLRGDITGVIYCEGAVKRAAQLELYRDGELYGMTSTGSNGDSFALERYSVGSYVLKITLKDHKTMEIPLELTVDGVNLGDIMMEALKADQSVTIKSEGSETDEILLQLYIGEEEYRSYVITGNYVTFVMEDLVVGTEYRLVISKANHYSNEVQWMVEEGAGIGIALQPITGPVQGTITTSDGAAVKNALVEFLQGDRVVKTVQSNGRYVCYAMVGQYILRISMEGYETAEIPVEITENALTLDVELKKEEVVSSVAGTVTNFLTEGEVTVQLLRDGQVVYSAVVSGKNAEFSLEGVENGTYTLRISKENHTPLEQTVEIGEEPLDLNLKICPEGDATGDGVVNIKDFQRMLRHINKTNPLEGYALDCGDLTGDGQCNIKDFQRLLRHINKTKPLY